MHEVLVNRLGGLSLPRKSVVRLTDRPDMTLDVYRGRKTTIQHLIGNQCKEIKTCLEKNSKRAYQLVKDLTSEKQGRSSTIQDKSGKCLTEEQEILSRWTEY